MKESDMGLLKPLLAVQFLEQYKRLLSEVAGRSLHGLADFGHARSTLYADGLNKTFPMGKSYDRLFIDAVRGAKYGTFIYAKKYKQGYALKASDNCWHCVKALTTPLEELVGDWVVIVTAVLPFHGYDLCDGLVVNRNVLIGRNMISSMIQELKLERRKWSSTQRIQRTTAAEAQ